MKHWFLFLSIVAATTAQAQYITTSVDTVDLGVVFEDQADSALVYLKNDSPAWSYFIVGYHKAFPFYGDTVVDAHYSTQIVYQGDSLPVWIVAKPMHNVEHKGSILVFDSGAGGEVIIPYKFQGRYSNNYYAATENKTEATLRTQLKNTISAGYTQLSYNNARDEMYSDLDNVNGDVECVYTGRTATFNTRPGANANSFNCEHTFPQGFFNQSLPMRSDIHHLFPTDVNANSQRGNLPFGTVSNPSWQQGGSKKNNTTFEPHDAQKGATARGLMYFVTRYQDYSNHFSGQESILRQWHNQYPPSQSERDRNDGIYLLQNNRNPFVDYPQFAARITNLVGPTAAPDAPAIYVVDTIELAFDSLSMATKQYRLYVMNYGNTAVDLEDFQFSTGSLQFVNGTGADVFVQPRASAELVFSFDLGTNYNGQTLSFTAELGSTINQTVYIKRGPIPQTSIEEWAESFNVKIRLDEIIWNAQQTSGRLTVLNVLGQQVAEAALSNARLQIGQLAGGVYILNISAKGRSFSQKFVITH